MLLPDLSRLSLKAESVDGRYDDAPPAGVALAALLDHGVFVEPIDDPQETPYGFRMGVRNPQRGDEVKEELFGMPQLADGTNHGGRFWLECVECTVMHDDVSRTGKVKRVVELALRSEGSRGSYSARDFDEALETLASGFEAPLAFKVDVKGRPTSTNNPFRSREKMLEGVVRAVHLLVANAVGVPTESESDSE